LIYNSEVALEAVDIEALRPRFAGNHVSTLVVAERADNRAAVAGLTTAEAALGGDTLGGGKDEKDGNDAREHCDVT